MNLTVILVTAFICAAVVGVSWAHAWRDRDNWKIYLAEAEQEKS